MHKWKPVASILALSVSMMPIVGNCVTLSETEWDSAEVETLTSTLPGTSASFSISSSGNPAPALEFSYSMTIGPNQSNSVFGVATSSNLVMLDPFSSVSWSYDVFLRPTVAGGTVVTTPGVATLGLFQNDKFYSYTISIDSIFNQWQTVGANNLTASDFALMDTATLALVPSEHPDFDQGEVLFFLALGVTDTNVGRTTIRSSNTISFDNFNVVLPPVPEPSTYAMFSMGVLALIALRCRRACRSRGISSLTDS